ncbi:MAG: KH domain-containing protein, partial [Acidimicrobiales bacterium]
DEDEDDDDLDEDDDDLDIGTVEGEYEPGDVNTVAPRRGRDDGNKVGASAAGSGGRAAAGVDESSSREEMTVEVLTYLARAMSEDPDSVVIRREGRRGSTVLRLHVAPGDMGRVIGRRGRTAQAIRTLVGAAGAREGVQTAVDIVDD